MQQNKSTTVYFKCWTPTNPCEHYHFYIQTHSSFLSCILVHKYSWTNVHRHAWAQEAQLDFKVFFSILTFSDTASCFSSESVGEVSFSWRFSISALKFSMSCWLKENKFVNNQNFIQNYDKIVNYSK